MHKAFILKPRGILIFRSRELAWRALQNASRKKGENTSDYFAGPSKSSFISPSGNFDFQIRKPTCLHTFDCICGSIFALSSQLAWRVAPLPRNFSPVRNMSFTPLIPPRVLRIRLESCGLSELCRSSPVRRSPLTQVPMQTSPHRFKLLGCKVWIHGLRCNAWTGV